MQSDVDFDSSVADVFVVVVVIFNFFYHETLDCITTHLCVWVGWGGGVYVFALARLESACVC